jgi:hypothetical protein
LNVYHAMWRNKQIEIELASVTHELRWVA